ncbi:MAG TPA: hypothetical protein DEG47_17445 [Cyanobacteria bacterium UBA11148]|nr:hypothetical protein [Cyanobacteria bacterium UBA11148]
MIASLVEEANNLPTFAKRSILVGGEGYALPYHQGYYTQVYQRTVDLIKAQYSQDLTEVKGFIEKYGVDFWLVERGFFKPNYIANNGWIEEYQLAATDAEATIKQGNVPILVQGIKKCSTFKVKNLVVLQAKCIQEMKDDV